MSEKTMTGDEWLIVKRDLYFRPDKQGYTGIRDEAGRYSYEEAKSYADHGCSMVKLSEALEFTAACYPDLRASHIRKQRAALPVDPPQSSPASELSVGANTDKPAPGVLGSLPSGGSSPMVTSGSTGAGTQISDFLNAVYDAIGDLETDKEGNVRWSALVNIQREIGEKARIYASPQSGQMTTDELWAAIRQRDANMNMAFPLMREIDDLDHHGRYGRLAREAMAWLRTPTSPHIPGGMCPDEETAILREARDLAITNRNHWQAEAERLGGVVERAQAIVQQLAWYYSVNDCDERHQDDALEVPILDLWAANQLAQELGLPRGPAVIKLVIPSTDSRGDGA